MRKLYLTEKHKKHFVRRAKKSLKRRLKGKRKTRNIRRSFEKKNQTYRNRIKVFPEKMWTHAPKQLCFLINTQEVIEFIEKIENSIKLKRKTFINLRGVIEIDYAAITILLSVMFRFRKKKILFDGNYPKNGQVTKKLVDSQFFECLFKPENQTLEYNIQKDNQILGRGSNEIIPNLGLTIMPQVTDTIWGEQRICTGLNPILMELMLNTYEWASNKSSDKESWWLSINHNKKDNKVSFVFLDYGQGIFESLSKKPLWQKIKQLGGDKITNVELLKMILAGTKRQSATRKSYRGTGLRSIKKSLDRNQINNFSIISNEIHSNVARNEYNVLKSKFNGTIVYWEIGKNNRSKIWKI